MKNIFLALVFCFCSSALALGVGDAAPNIELQHVVGLGTEEVMDVSSSHNGKPVVIEFFLVKCPYCVENYPNYVQLATQFADKANFKLVGIERNEADARAWYAEHNPPATLVLDTKRSAIKSYGARGVPHTYVVDGNGKIIFSHEGVWGAAEIATLKSLLQ